MARTFEAFGTKMRTATTRPFIIIGRKFEARTILPGMTTAEYAALPITYGEPFIEGYAETIGAAEKRVARERRRRPRIEFKIVAL